LEQNDIGTPLLLLLLCGHEYEFDELLYGQQAIDGDLEEIDTKKAQDSLSFLLLLIFISRIELLLPRYLVNFMQMPHLGDVRVTL